MAELRQDLRDLINAHANALPWKVLQKLPYDGLVTLHDHVVVNSAAYHDYRQELARRDAMAQGDRIERSTLHMRNLTIWIVVLTVINVAAAALAAWATFHR